MKYKNDRIISIAFIVPIENYLPFYIVKDVEEFLQERNCVISMEGYIGDKIECTICSSNAVRKLLLENTIVIANKFCEYEITEKNIQRIRIISPPRYLQEHEIESIIEQYASIITSEFEDLEEGRAFFALVQLKTPIPKVIFLNNCACKVVVEECK